VRDRVSRTNQVLLVLVVGLAVMAAWVRFRDPRGSKHARAPLDFDVEEVLALEIQNRHGTIRLERREDRWFVVEPFRYPGDTLKIATLVANLATIRTRRPLESGETPLAKLREAGLDRRAARFTLRGPDWQIGGVVGEPPKLGRRTFMAVDGRSGVFTLVSSQAAVFFEAPDAFRDARALRFETGGLNEVAWESGCGRVCIRDRGAGWWSLEEPAEGPVHPDAFEELFAGLRRLRILEWLAPSGATPEVTGLEHARRRITVGWSLDGRPANDTLVLGHDKDGRLHARHEGEEPLFLVDRPAVERILALSAKDLRDDVVLRIREGEMDRVRLAGKDGSARTYRWDGSEWLTSEGRPAPPERIEAVTRLLTALGTERIARFLPLESGGESVSEPRPQFTLEVDFRGRRPPAILRFAAVSAGLIHVRRGEERILLGVEARIFTPLLAPFEEGDRSPRK